MNKPSDAWNLKPLNPDSSSFEVCMNLKLNILLDLLPLQSWENTGITVAGHASNFESDPEKSRLSTATSHGAGAENHSRLEDLHRDS